GHGNRSGETGPFSIKTFSEELKMYIKQNNLERPAIIGYSMGGYVALYTALFTEGFLGDIITIATKFNWTPESSKKEAGYLQPKLMQAKVPQLVMQLEERHGSNWTAVANKTAEMMLQLGENTLLTTENIGRIKNRVKFCVGDKDKMVSIEETYAMYKNVPGASFCVLPGTGHLPEGMSAKRIKFEVEEFILRK
ncbi:MAG TPA: alpha/beta hydrolase, partial [Bacteroidia bacterium]|nr:alpha/beta hydrolase [Bacteroidia bacterium]